MERVRKFFTQTNLTWKKIIIFAVIAGVYTGITATLPFAQNTSLADISVSFEWWVLFGIFIILNSKSALDSALKCFVFFLISQPLVYLVQVPFCSDGWSIFGNYKMWFIWTLLTFPMGFIGHYMKKGKWWGLLILAPMLLLVGVHYYEFLNSTITCFPYHLFSAVFCAATVLLYPVITFENKKIKYIGLSIAAAILIVATVFAVTGKHEFYTTNILTSAESGEEYFDDSYTVSLADESYGKVSIVGNDEFGVYTVHAEFKRPGKTQLILTSPDGRKTVYTLTVAKNTYDLELAERDN